MSSSLPHPYRPALFPTRLVLSPRAVWFITYPPWGSGSIKLSREGIPLFVACAPRPRQEEPAGRSSLLSNTKQRYAIPRYPPNFYRDFFGKSESFLKNCLVHIYYLNGHSSSSVVVGSNHGLYPARPSSKTDGKEILFRNSLNMAGDSISCFLFSLITTKSCSFSMPR